GRWTAVGVAVGKHLCRIACGTVQYIGRDKIFRKVDVLSLKVPLHHVRRILLKRQRERLRGIVKACNRERGMQLEIDAEKSCCLRLIRVRAQRNRKIGFLVFDRNGLMVFKFEPLGTKCRNGDDTSAEDRAAFRFFRSALAHLQKPRIDRLLLELVVDFFRALALQDHRWNPRWTVPNREVGHHGKARQRKNVIALLDSAGVIRKDLADKDSHVAVVDADRDLHLFERQNRWIGLGLAAWNQYSTVSAQERRNQEQNEQDTGDFSHSFSRFSSARTSPLSVPT